MSPDDRGEPTSVNWCRTPEVCPRWACAQLLGGTRLLAGAVPPSVSPCGQVLGGSPASSSCRHIEQAARRPPSLPGRTACTAVFIALRTAPAAASVGSYGPVPAPSPGAGGRVALQRISRFGQDSHRSPPFRQGRRVCPPPDQGSIQDASPGACSAGADHTGEHPNWRSQACRRGFLIAGCRACSPADADLVFLVKRTTRAADKVMSGRPYWLSIGMILTSGQGRRGFLGRFSRRWTSPARAGGGRQAHPSTRWSTAGLTLPGWAPMAQRKPRRR